MLQELRLFLTAVQFFTRIPVPAWVGHSAQQLEQAARYFPLVGICVGVLSAATLWLGAQVLPLTLAVGLSMAASIIVTGAFHEDGLSDFADGMGGGHSKEKTLAIMKDSRVGVYGVIALVLVLLLKYQALLELCGAQSPLFVAAVLIAAHAISRLLAASIMLTQRYARDDDSARAKPAAQSLSHNAFACAAVFALVPLVWLDTGGGVAAAGVAMALRIVVAQYFYRRIGGYTGDCLGAVQQITEVGFYLGLLAWIST